jgi:hypothetical protein
MNALLEDIDISRVAALTTAGTTEIISSYVDMQGWDGAIFFTDIATANAGNFAYIRQSLVSDGSSSVVHLSGTRSIAASNGQTVRTTVHEPRNGLGRFVAVAVIRAGASTALGEIWCIRYKTKRGPQAIGINRIAQSPAGTASGTGA